MDGCQNGTTDPSEVMGASFVLVQNRNCQISIQGFSENTFINM